MPNISSSVIDDYNPLARSEGLTLVSEGLARLLSNHDDMFLSVVGCLQLRLVAANLGIAPKVIADPRLHLKWRGEAQRVMSVNKIPIKQRERDNGFSK